MWLVVVVILTSGSRSPHASEMIVKFGSGIVIRCALWLAESEVAQFDCVSVCSVRLLDDLVEGTPDCSTEGALAVSRLVVTGTPE